MGQLLLRESAERTATGCQKNLFYLVVTLANDALEDGGVFAVDGKNGHMMFLCQATNQLTSHDKRLLIGQTDFLARTDSMKGGRKTGETDHGGEHHVDRVSLDNLIQGLTSGVHLHIGQVFKQVLQRLIVTLVGDDHGGRMKLTCLFSQQSISTVGGQAVDLIAVRMLGNDL